MKPVKDFLPRLAVHLPACPAPTMAQALVDSAIAFCDESMVLRAHLDAFWTVAGTALYELDAPPQQQVSRVLRVSLDGAFLSPTLPNTSHAMSLSGRPTRYETSRADSVFELALYSVPDGAYSVTVEAALRPLRDATQLEDDLMNLWVEPIVAGAIARAAAIPNQPFTDPGKAQNAALAATVGTRKARLEGSFGHVRGSVSARVKHRLF